MIVSRTGGTQIFKIKSHQEDLGVEELLAQERNYQHIAGNCLADAAAEAAASVSLPSCDSVRKTNHANAVGFAVAKRIAIVQADEWRSREGKRIYSVPVAQEVTPVDQRFVNASTFSEIVKNGHFLIREGGDWLAEVRPV